MMNPLKVLMLEDSTADAEILQYFLLREKPDCIFNVVMTEQAFLSALYEFKPDVIISDNSLPAYSATEALLLFKRLDIPIPFILVTGTVSEEFAASIIKQGADDYILKDRLIRLPAAIDAALKKKKIEADKVKAEERISFKANLLNTVGQAVIATDMKGIVLYWNNAAEKIYGWTTEEAMGKNIVTLTPSMQSVEDAMAIMEELQSGNSWSGEFLVKRKDGNIFPAFVTDSPFFDEQGKVAGIIGVSIDITERKLAEEKLRVMENKIAEQKIQEQKKISRAIIQAQEQEKNYIGQELHDNINQILVGAKMFLSVTAKKNSDIGQLLEYPIELINNSIEEIRSLTYKQVTPLKNIDLSGQIQKLISGVGRSSAQKINFLCTVPESVLSDDLKLNIYRIIQEQVNNILKHADAKKIKISVTYDNKNIEILVEDDGKGFNTKRKRKGIGISNMINRVELYDGRFDITSSPGNGCVLDVLIPVKTL